MKAVMLSIQPNWCVFIANKNKRLEMRKTKPNIQTPFKVYIYCTKQGRPLVYGSPSPSYVDEKYVQTHGYSKKDADRIFGNMQGKVIGEFVCDYIRHFESEFVDNDCQEQIQEILMDEDGEQIYVGYWSNDSGIPYEKTTIYEESCVSYEELKKYLGIGFSEFYGWHISSLVIYDKPKGLHHFFKPCGNCDKKGTRRCTEELTYCRAKVITRPPQSWCYVESRCEE